LQYCNNIVFIGDTFVIYRFQRFGHLLIHIHTP
jgi:hypothetical protein